MSFQKLPFLDVFKDASGGNIKTLQREFLEEGEIPVVDQGQRLVAGFVNDRSRVCKAKPPVIVFGDHTRAIKYVDFEFAMGADGTKVLVPKVESDTKYLYYALNAVDDPRSRVQSALQILEGNSNTPPAPRRAEADCEDSWMRRTPCEPSAARPSLNSTNSSNPPSSKCSGIPSQTQCFVCHHDRVGDQVH